MKITFDESAKDFVLDTFGLTVDSEGFIVSKDNLLIRSLTNKGKEVHINDFGGIGPNGIFENDLLSILNLVDAE